MTPKQILDSFTETLMRDERILSARERALLRNLLQHAKTASSGNEETQEAVRAVIASAVGETVAQRAFSVLGSSIVERILGGEESSRSEGGISFGDTSVHERSAVKTTPGVPTPPGPQPPASPVRTPAVPAPAPGPQPPASPLRVPIVPPPTTGPQTPGHGKVTTVVSEGCLAVEDKPARLAARCVVLDEFLAPQELEELIRFTHENASQFQASEVVSPSAERGEVNYDHRRSRVLMDLSQYEALMLARIKTVLPDVLEQLGMPEFDISAVEMQITASNDGDFFHFHSDNGEDRVASRHLTFVYFFHREPRQFEGGELRLHDAHLEHGKYVSDGSYQSVTPQQNQIVFFPCELLHEITPVECGSQLFADSRFTLNGWLRQ
jgi:Rps23 Pro-64 3,4-dihydroxylase Tpa1-like proline 4-hydroxylase